MYFLVVASDDVAKKSWCYGRRQSGGGERADEEKEDTGSGVEEDREDRAEAGKEKGKTEEEE